MRPALYGEQVGGNDYVLDPLHHRRHRGHYRGTQAARLVLSSSALRDREARIRGPLCVARRVEGGHTHAFSMWWRSGQAGRTSAAIRPSATRSRTPSNGRQRIWARCRTSRPIRSRRQAGGGVSGAASGSQRRNAVPWSAPGLSAQIRPPCRSTIWRQMNRPKPSP
jgi:hypothetical protein